MATKNIITMEMLAEAEKSYLFKGNEASGDLSGSYPNPTIKPGAVTPVKVGDGLVVAEEGIIISRDPKTGVYTIGRKPEIPNVGMHHIQFYGEPTPAEMWAGTTWEIDTDYQGRTLVGSGGAYSLGGKGGSADAIVVNHRHYSAYINDSYAQENQLTWGTVNNLAAGSGVSAIGPRALSDGSAALVTSYDGESGTNKNMQPYTVVNYWKRIK